MTSNESIGLRVSHTQYKRVKKIQQGAFMKEIFSDNSGTDGSVFWRNFRRTRITLLAKGRMAAAQIQQQSYWPSAIQLFNDPQNIKSLSDQHLVELQEFLSFLKQWKAEAGYESCKKVFISKLWFDLQSMILGFESIVAIKLKKFSQSVIEPPIIKVARLGVLRPQM